VGLYYHEAGQKRPQANRKIIGFGIKCGIDSKINIYGNATTARTILRIN
jgi:hypothetical protein